MTKEELKAYLISIDYAEDNEHLDAYVDLVTTTDPNPQTKHHIIPRHYYQMHSMEVNDLDENLANLSFSNHVKAHYYLSLCSKGQYKHKNIYAFNLLNPLKYLDIESLPEYDSIYDEFKKHQSDIHKGKPSWNKGVKNTTHKPMNEEGRAKVSKANTGKYKGHKCIHLGNVDKRLPYEQAQLLVNHGWSWGRSDRIRKALSVGAKAGWDNGTQKGMSGKHQSETQRKAARDANIGNKNALGCKRSEETIQKIRDTKKRNKQPIETN